MHTLWNLSGRFILKLNEYNAYNQINSKATKQNKTKAIEYFVIGISSKTKNKDAKIDCQIKAKNSNRH